MTIRMSQTSLRKVAALGAALLLLSFFVLACDGGDNGTGPLPAESTTAGNCADNVDNDGDGQTDGADPNCGNETAGNNNCADTIDNDGDGATDCEGFGNNSSDPQCPCAIESNANLNCADGVDNDDDGDTDPADSGCACPDADNDGVCTASDNCPGTPTGCDVDINGCEADADNDGVCDGVDQCPASDPGCGAVDAFGCPVDTDGDGVCNADDNCAGTIFGCDVDADGCESDTDNDQVCDGNDACDNTDVGCVVGADGCPVTDTDGDGVCNGVDQCVTPANCDVGADGCSLDADNDGVCDGVDQCPGSVPGCPVSPVTGCPLAACGNCSTDTVGGQVDEDARYSDSNVSQPGCGQNFDMCLLIERDAGFLTVNVFLEDRNGNAGGGSPDPGIDDACTADCSLDGNTFSCDVQDDNGNTRTITGTVPPGGGNVAGTIETSCGGTAPFSAAPMSDGICN